jgi:arylsulfatase A-like enzyme
LIEAAEKKPNIVFVLFDDMGWGQPHCYEPTTKLPATDSTPINRPIHGTIHRPAAP